MTRRSAPVAPRWNPRSPAWERWADVVAISTDGTVTAYEGGCRFDEDYLGWFPVDPERRWEVIGKLETDVSVAISRQLRWDLPRRGWRAV